MKLLAIDTATEQCSTALWVDGDVSQRIEPTSRGHTRLLIPMVNSLLEEAGLELVHLDAIAVDNGPGSFTGVRIGLGHSQGLAFGAGLPIITINSLDVLGAATGDALTACAIDARMGQVYWSAVKRLGDGDMSAVEEPIVTEPDKVSVPGEGEMAAAGSGWRTYSNELSQALRNRQVKPVTRFLPDAATLAGLAATRFPQACLSPEDAVALYVRNNVATSA